MPHDPTPPKPQPYRGKLPSVREVDGRHSSTELPRAASRGLDRTLPGSPAPAAQGSVTPPPLRDASDDESSTAVKSRDHLLDRHAETVRENAELRAALAAAKMRPVVVEAAEPLGPELTFRAGSSKWWIALLGGVLGLAGGAGGSEAARYAHQLDEPPVTAAQLGLVRDDLRAIAERVRLQGDYLVGQSSDLADWQRLDSAFMCAQRTVLAEGMSCTDVLSAVPVNPDPLAASKPPPQLVIHGARRPPPRLPPKSP